jgi:Holliday junction resolvasome RuvABC endonuclease subunit
MLGYVNPQDPTIQRIGLAILEGSSTLCAVTDLLLSKGVITEEELQEKQDRYRELITQKEEPIRCHTVSQ